MDIKHSKKPQTTLTSLLFIIIGTFLSGNGFAAGVSGVKLAAERNARINADTTLTTNLAAEKNARIAADATEANARIAAVTAEVAARQVAIQAAINALQAQLNAIALPLPPASGIRPKVGLSLKLCPNNDTPQWDHCPLAIGDAGPAGGIVFYVSDGGMHGLEAAPVDQSTAAPWGCYVTVITGATGTAVGSGAQNTLDILAGCNEVGIAAKVASDYTLNGYDDWFLPSKEELNLMYANIGQGALAPFTNVGGFAIGDYWSSTEFTGSYARLQIFGTGTQLFLDKISTLRVRAIRAF